MIEPATTVGGLLVGFGGFRAAAAANGRLELLDRIDDDVVVSDLTKWIGIVPLLGWVIAVENAGLGSLTGERLERTTFVAVVAGGLIATFVTSAAVQRVTSVFGVEGVAGGDGLAAIADRSVPAILFTAVTAGVTEELLYRGYVVERLLRMTGSPVVAGGVSVLAFGIAHYGHWSVGETIEITVHGTVLVGIYVLTRSLPALIVIHVLHDAIGTLLARRALARGEIPETTNTDETASPRPPDE